MSIKYSGINKEGLSTQIADAIRSAILEGRLMVEERLPSETELAERFGVSRPTVREALKRLAAQNLIRTQRGPTGGAFVNRLSWSEAHDAMVTTSTMLIGINNIEVDAVVEARLALETACIPLAVQRHQIDHLDSMRREIARQESDDLTDEEFCASDVRFHRALVDAAGNPVLSFQMAGIIEGMQPLMNMLTYRMRDRARISEFHAQIVTAMERQKTKEVIESLRSLSDYTLELLAARQRKT